MADDPNSAIEKILDDIDTMTRRRLTKLGFGETGHMILAISPDGAGVIRSNCDAEGLREMAAMLIEVVNQIGG